MMILNFEKLKSDKRFLYFMVYVYAIVGYSITNKVDFLEKHPLSLTFIDHALDFTPWTAWIYITIYFMPLFCAFIVKKEEHYKPLINSFVAVSSVAFLFFIFYPTVYVRPTFEHTGLATLPLVYVYHFDAPTNCFPSLHVVYAFLSAYFVIPYKRRLGYFLLFWAVLVSASTITTRQHYFYDVLSGILLATAAYFYYMKEKKT